MFKVQKITILALICYGNLLAHDISSLKDFVSGLNSIQKADSVRYFEHDERKIWNFIPKERNGLRWDALAKSQQAAFKISLKSFLSKEGIQKTFEIMQLEELVRIMEGRPIGDTRRDPSNYCINFYGKPGDDFWTFRYEGHHVSLNFSGMKDKIVSATPFFWGTNPAIAKEGPKKGLEVLKDEQRLPRALVCSLSSSQKSKAVVYAKTPRELLTRAKSIAPPLDDNGLPYSEMTTNQQIKFIEIIDIYMRRYSKNVTSAIVKEWKKNDWKDYKFAWAGGTSIGDPHYYRIKGPVLLLEYCNTQGGANHLHTSIRDYQNDFGDDAFRKHLKDHHD